MYITDDANRIITGADYELSTLQIALHDVQKDRVSTETLQKLNDVSQRLKIVSRKLRHVQNVLARAYLEQEQIYD